MEKWIVSFFLGVKYAAQHAERNVESSDRLNVDNRDYFSAEPVLRREVQKILLRLFQA